MEFLDKVGLSKFKELLDLDLSTNYAKKSDITAKNFTSTIHPENTRQRFNDNQIYFMFDDQSGNEDRKINLYVNRDNDFNATHTGIKEYHFMDGLSCPTDGLKGDYSTIVAKNFIIKDGNKSATIGIDNIDVSLDLDNFYTKSEVNSKVSTAVSGLESSIDEELEDYVKTQDLSGVAFSGDYTDLSNKPTIPTVPTITTGSTNGTISVGGTDVSVRGLGDAAYYSHSDFADSDHDHSQIIGTANRAIADENGLSIDSGYVKKSELSTLVSEILRGYGLIQ